MSSGLRFIAGLLALSFGLAVLPANALSSRSQGFVFACRGDQQHVVLDFTKTLGFPANSTQFVQGAQIVLTENKTEGDSGRSAIQYIVLSVSGDITQEILLMGILQNNAQALFPFPGYKLTADAAGRLPTFAIDAACNGGFGNQQIQGIVTIFFVQP